MDDESAPHVLVVKKEEEITIYENSPFVLNAARKKKFSAVMGSMMHDFNILSRGEKFESQYQISRIRLALDLFRHKIYIKVSHNYIFIYATLYTIRYSLDTPIIIHVKPIIIKFKFCQCSKFTIFWFAKIIFIRSSEE